MSAFTPLRVRSHGSLLEGTAAPEALLARALEHGARRVALTDRDNLYLAIRFVQACRAEGVTPIVGAIVTARRDPGAARAAAAGAPLPPAPEALLLALDRRGYANLCAILSARHLDADFHLARALGAHHAGLHVVVESSALAEALLAAGVPVADGAGARPARGAATPGGLWLGVRGLGDERRALGARIAAARRLGLATLATGDVVMRDAGDHDVHRVAVTAAAGELLDRMPAAAFAAREAWQAAPDEWERRVRAACAAAGVPDVADEALANNRVAAARCRLDLELGVPVFPRAPLPEGETGAARLLALCTAGVTRRYGGRHGGVRQALARLRDELAMIERLGFTDYFLLVAGIVEFTRARGIPSVGRGSGASSLVAYALGITNVDPIRHDLTFERFLNPTRRDCPDLDIDLCWRRRDEVIAHVYDAYGADRVAMICTHATLGARSAFRETAKALGVPNARVNQLARRIPRELERPYLERLRALPEARAVDWSQPPLARALRLAEGLDGAPRHLSVHSGGIVIGDRPLTWYVPLERAAKGVIVTQFEMRAIEAIGLVKMDLLGNRALTTLAECVTLVSRHRGLDVSLDRIPARDARAGARIRAGDTLNCFQLESPAMRHLLRMLRCGTLDETIAAVALIRPGAAESGMKEVYCRRHRGLEPPTFAHPRLEPLLGPTYGVMLYEEDVIRVAAALAGFSLAEGDDLRRAIGHARDDEEFRALERGFVAHCGRTGIAPDTARAAWRDLTRFAAYAFCKAHAAGYGTLGWQCAWLKTRFPAEWAVAVLNHHAGMYATWVHVEDLRRRGVEFRAPCAQRSAWDSTLEPVGFGVRVGLSRVFGLAVATGERIHAARPFASLADLLDRARPTLPEAEALVLAGALDWTARSRASLLLEARVTLAGVGRGAARAAAPALVAAGGEALAVPAVAPVAVPALPELDVAARVRGECRSTGLWFNGHPLAPFADHADARDAVPAASLPERVGRRVAIVGMPCATRRVETKRGESMLFVTLADASGLAECVLFPDAYRALAGATRGEVVRIEGRVDETLDAVALTVERAKVLG